MGVILLCFQTAEESPWCLVQFDWIASTRGAITPGSIGDIVQKNKGAVGHMWTQLSHPLMQNTKTGPGSPRRGGFSSVFVGTLERFIWSENISDPATGRNSLDMFCLATGANRTLVNMDNMVEHLYNAVFTWNCFTEHSSTLFFSPFVDSRFYKLHCLWHPTSGKSVYPPECCRGISPPRCKQVNLRLI